MDDSRAMLRRLVASATVLITVFLLGRASFVPALQALMTNRASVKLLQVIPNSASRELLRSRDTLQHAASLDHGNPAVSRQLAFVCMAQQDFICARKALEAGLTSAPGDALLEFRLGELEALSGDEVAALTAWKRADAAAYFFYQGKNAGDRDDTPSALHHLEIAARIQPEVSDAFYLLGWLQERLGRWQEARDNYERAVANHHFNWYDYPDTVMLARAYIGLGYAEYQTTQNLERARRSLNLAVAMNPGDAWAFIRLCDVNRLAGELIAALAACDEAVRVMPNQHWSFFSRARTLMAAQRYELARQDLGRALLLDPTYSPARDALDEVLEHLPAR